MQLVSAIREKNSRTFLARYDFFLLKHYADVAKIPCRFFSIKQLLALYRNPALLYSSLLTCRCSALSQQLGSDILNSKLKVYIFSQTFARRRKKKLSPRYENFLAESESMHPACPTSFSHYLLYLISSVELKCDSIAPLGNLKFA